MYYYLLLLFQNKERILSREWNKIVQPIRPHICTIVSDIIYLYEKNSKALFTPQRYAIVCMLCSGTRKILLLLPSSSFSSLLFFFFFFLKRQKKKIVGRGPTAHIWTEYIHNDDGKTLISGVLRPRFLFLFLYLIHRHSKADHWKYS